VLNLSRRRPVRAVFTVGGDRELLSAQLAPFWRLQRALTGALVDALMRNAAGDAALRGVRRAAVETRTLDQGHGSRPSHLMVRGRVGTRDGSSLQAMNSAAEANASAISGLSAAAVR
jgi:hypothetical protein